MYSARLVFFVCNLVGTILGLAFIIPSVICLRNKDYKSKLIPLKVLFYFLVICEIIKIYYLISSTPGFNPKSYPIIYCSSIMYLLFIICYTKRDSIINRIGKGGFIIPFLVIGGLYFFSFPGLDRMMNLRNFILNVHSRVYHILAFFAALYMIIVHLYDFRFKDFLPVSSYSAIYFQCCTFLSIAIGGEISNFGTNSQELIGYYNVVGYATGNLYLGIAAIFLSFIIYYIIYIIRKNKSSNKQEKIAGLINS